MAKRKAKKRRAASKRPERLKLTAEESIRRMQDFPKRMKQFVAAVREGKPYLFTPSGKPIKRSS